MLYSLLNKINIDHEESLDSGISKFDLLARVWGNLPYAITDWAFI